MTSEGRRLHHAAVLAGVLDQLRSLALPIIVFALLGGRGGGESLTRLVIYTVIGIAASAALSGLYWATTRWSIDDQSVRLRTGVLSEKVTTVPFERVQAVDTVRGPIQRLFGVVELHVQTAGGGNKAEIVLKAVSEREAEDVREAVRRGGSAAAVAEESDAVVWELGMRSLVIAAATSASFGVLVPFAVAAGQVGNDILSSSAAEGLLPDTPAQALRDVFIVVVAAWVLSFVGTLVAFAGFRLTRDGERLRIHRGFLQRRDASVPVARVHALRIVEGPLRERFGLAQVRVDTAGYAKEPSTAQTLLPLVRRSEVPALIARFLPEFEGELGGLEPLPRRAARRYAVPLVLPWVLVAVVVAPVLGIWALIPAALALAGVVLGSARYRAAAYRVDGDRVVIRGRRFARVTAVANAARLQHLDVSANPFQRRAHLATLAIAIGSGRRIPLRHVGADVADGLFASLGKRSLG